MLTHLDDPHAPAWLGEIPAVQVLRQVWTQQFYSNPMQVVKRSQGFSRLKP